MMKRKSILSICAAILLIAALIVPAYAATSVEDQMAANSAAWHVAKAAGDTATCEALHAANVALANQAASGGGSASYDGASGTWNITTSSGSNISSSSSGSGKDKSVTYTTTTSSGKTSSTSTSTFSGSSISAYKNYGGTNEGLERSYNNVASDVSTNGKYTSVTSAASEAAVVKELLGLTDAQARQLQADLEASKQAYSAASAEYKAAVAAGDTAAAERARAQMDAAHDAAEATRAEYNYSGDSDEYSDGGYYNETEKPKSTSGTLGGFFNRITSSYTITASCGNGGTISPSGNVKVEKGASKTFNFTPNYGYRVKSIVVDGEEKNAANSYTFINVIRAHTINVSFEKDVLAITASCSEGGTISPNGRTEVKRGASKTYTITPNTGYVIKSVVVDGTDTGVRTSYTFSNITTSHTINAVFEKLSYTIKASAGTGGTISPSGTTSVEYGSSKTFTITPSAGYAIKDVKVDGISKGAIGSYKFSNVTKAHTISASFKVNGTLDIGTISVTDSLGTSLAGKSIKSGYGICVNVPVSDSGVSDVKATMSYKFGTRTKTITLQKSGSSYVLPVNSDSPTNARCVYIPVETADGSYTLTITVTAKRADGVQITKNASATVKVLGNMYEDDYTGDS